MHELEQDIAAQSAHLIGTPYLMPHDDEAVTTCIP